MDMRDVGEFALALVLAAWKAFVLSVVWGWFVVPLGAPAIGVLHAYGLMLMLSLVTYSIDRHKKLEEIATSEKLVFGFVHPAVALAISGAVYFFI